MNYTHLLYYRSNNKTLLKHIILYYCHCTVEYKLKPTKTQYTCIQWRSQELPERGGVNDLFLVTSKIYCSGEVKCTELYVN